MHGFVLCLGSLDVIRVATENKRHQLNTALFHPSLFVPPKFLFLLLLLFYRTYPALSPFSLFSSQPDGLEQGVVQEADQKPIKVISDAGRDLDYCWGKYIYPPRL